jgi:hypothetical protein
MISLQRYPQDELIAATNDHKRNAPAIGSYINKIEEYAKDSRNGKLLLTMSHDIDSFKGVMNNMFHPHLGHQIRYQRSTALFMPPKRCLIE